MIQHGDESARTTVRQGRLVTGMEFKGAPKISIIKIKMY